MQPRSLTHTTGARLVLWLALGAIVAVLILGTTRGTVLAATSLHQTPPIAWNDPEFLEDEEECAEYGLAAGEVVWHFVLVQTSNTSGTLTATFTGGATYTVSGWKTGSTMHFLVGPTGPTTLLSATTTANGRLLNLSHICAGPPRTTTTTTTTTTSTSTSTSTHTSTTSTGS